MRRLVRRRVAEHDRDAAASRLSDGETLRWRDAESHTEPA